MPDHLTAASFKTTQIAMHANNVKPIAIDVRSTTWTAAPIRIEIAHGLGDLCRCFPFSLTGRNVDGQNEFFAGILLTAHDEKRLAHDGGSTISDACLSRCPK